MALLASHKVPPALLLAEDDRFCHSGATAKDFPQVPGTPLLNRLLQPLTPSTAATTAVSTPVGTTTLRHGATEDAIIVSESRIFDSLHEQQWKPAIMHRANVGPRPTDEAATAAPHVVHPIAAESKWLCGKGPSCLPLVKLPQFTAVGPTAVGSNGFEQAEETSGAIQQAGTSLDAVLLQRYHGFSEPSVYLPHFLATASTPLGCPGARFSSEAWPATASLRPVAQICPTRAVLTEALLRRSGRCNLRDTSGARSAALILANGACDLKVVVAAVRRMAQCPAIAHDAVRSAWKALAVATAADEKHKVCMMRSAVHQAASRLAWWHGEARERIAEAALSMWLWSCRGEQDKPILTSGPGGAIALTVLRQALANFKTQEGSITDTKKSAKAALCNGIHTCAELSGSEAVELLLVGISNVRGLILKLPSTIDMSPFLLTSCACVSGFEQNGALSAKASALELSNDSHKFPVTSKAVPSGLTWVSGTKRSGFAKVFVDDLNLPMQKPLTNLEDICQRRRPALSLAIAKLQHSFCHFIDATAARSELEMSAPTAPGHHLDTARLTFPLSAITSASLPCRVSKGTQNEITFRYSLAPTNREAPPFEDICISSWRRHLAAMQHAERRKLRSQRLCMHSRRWHLPQLPICCLVNDLAPRVLSVPSALHFSDHHATTPNAITTTNLLDGEADSTLIGEAPKVNTDAWPAAKLLSALGHEPGSWSWTFEEAV